MGIIKWFWEKKKKAILPGRWQVDWKRGPLPKVNQQTHTAQYALDEEIGKQGI